MRAASPGSVDTLGRRFAPHPTAIPDITVDIPDQWLRAKFFPRLSPSANAAFIPEPREKIGASFEKRRQSGWSGPE